MKGVSTLMVNTEFEVDALRGDPTHHLHFMRARIVMRGTDFSDYERVAAEVADWPTWWSAWEKLGAEYEQLAEEYAARGWSRSQGDALIRAGLAYHWSKSLAVKDDERYREVALRSVRAVAAGLTALDPTFERVEVSFGEGRLVGNLRRPAGDGPAPLVLLVPGLESVKEEFPTWEQHYLDRGMATLSIDGPGQGESGFDLRIRHDYETAVTAFLDHLASRPDLDTDRVGLAGISVGGHYVVRAAAHEPRVKAVLSNCGPWDFSDAFDQMEGLYKAKVLWNTGAATLAEAREAAGRLRLSGVAEQVTQPTLVVYGAADALIDASHGTDLAAALPNGELWMVEGGNHGVTNFPPRHLGPGADWMWEQLHR